MLLNSLTTMLILIFMTFINLTIHTMTQLEKQAIRDHLYAYCELKGSQNKAAASLKGVSSAVISQVLNGQWDLISDEMWRSIAAQTLFDRREWKTVETRGFRRMYDILDDAQGHAQVFAVTGDAGCGKSEAIAAYTASKRNVYTLSCSEYWNRKYFLLTLLKTMGREPQGFTVGEMMESVIYMLKKADHPLIILDEFDKLSDQVLYFFISIYNALEGHVGIVISSTGYLERRITRGLRSARKGYEEIYSRFGRRFIPMPVVNDEDVAAVCIANGVTDKKDVERIISDAACDLRRVKRLVHAFKARSNAKSSADAGNK